MTLAERRLQALLNSNADAYERSFAEESQFPDRTRLGVAKGNPKFDAQFDVSVLLFYFTVAAGVYTQRTAAFILATFPQLATQLPAFLFGNSDFAAGYAKLRSTFPLQGGWQYGSPFVVGRPIPNTVFGDLDANALAVLRPGDVVIPVTAVLAQNVVGFTVIRCTQVAYATLLDSLGSDKFVMNMIRYVMADTTPVGLAQLNNNISITKQSLFGKFDSDFISPNSFKVPEQQQNGIIDIPLVKGIDKQTALSTYVNFDATNVQWSIFVSQIDKV
jgi:hypothetical protein